VRAHDGSMACGARSCRTSGGVWIAGEQFVSVRGFRGWSHRGERQLSQLRALHGRLVGCRSSLEASSSSCLPRVDGLLDAALG
jgi:hypothetical protein